MKETHRSVAARTLVAGAALLGIAQHANAQSSVYMYGIIDTWVGAYKPVTAQHTSVGMFPDGMQGAFWGVGGQEDLGGGYKTIFALESFFQPNNGAIGRTAADPFWGRAAYTGMTTPFGTFRAGRLVTPYFKALVATDPMGQAPFFSPQAFVTYRGLQNTGLAGNTSLSNLVAYTSPTFFNTTADVVYGFGNAAGHLGQSQVQASINYVSQNLTINGALQNARYNNTAGDFPAGITNQLSYMVGAAYDFQVVKFFGQYQQMMTSATERIVNHVYQAGFTIKFNPANFLSASYVKAHANGITLNRDTWAIGYDYFASKRTDLYVAFLRDTATNYSAGKVIGAGIRHKF